MDKPTVVSSKQYISDYVFGRLNKLLRTNVEFSDEFIDRVNEVEREFIHADTEARKNNEIPYQNAQPLFYVTSVADIMRYVHFSYDPEHNFGVILNSEDTLSLIPFAEQNLDRIRNIHTRKRQNIARYVGFLPKEIIPLEHKLVQMGSRKIFDKGIASFKEKIESDLDGLLKDPNYVLKKGTYLNQLR